MDLSGKRLLVIGGGGFIGSHLVEALAREDVAEILVFDNFCRGSMANLETALKDPRVKVYEPTGDILHGDVLTSAMRGMDGVFHLAALWLLHCQDFPQAAFDVNIRGTFNVLEACRAAGVKRLVYSSSASVYGDAQEVPMTEEHPFANKTFYGATKIAGEQMCRAYHHRFGLNYVGLRYMNVYGERQDDRGAYTSVVMAMLGRIARDEPLVVYGDGSQTYDFIHVTDVARSNVRAMAADTSDQFFNVGRGIPTSIKEFAEAIMRVSGRNPGIEHRPAPAARGFVTHRVGSTEKARRLLGFEASVDLDEGIRRLLRARGIEPAAEIPPTGREALRTQ